MKSMSKFSQTSRQRSQSDAAAHSYNIQAKLQNGVLSIFVHDTMTNAQWRQEFTQVSYSGHKLYDVAKSLIMSIKEMLILAQSNSNNSKPKPISILVYNNWCYLTITNSKLPSFALRPINNNNNNKSHVYITRLNNNKCNKIPYTNNNNNNNNNDDKRTSLRILSLNNRLPSQKRHSITGKYNNPSYNGKRSIALPLPPQNSNNILRVPTNTKRQSPSLPGLTQSQSLPITNNYYPTRPLPTLPLPLPDLPHNNSAGNINNYHQPSSSVKFGQRKYIRQCNKYSMILGSNTLYNASVPIKIPSPPILKKPIAITTNHIPNYNTNSNANANTNTNKTEPILLNKSSGSSGSGSSSSYNIFDLSNCGSSEDYDIDIDNNYLIMDNIESPTNDEPSRIGSTDSNMGSLDSLFVATENNHQNDLSSLSGTSNDLKDNNHGYYDDDSDDDDDDDGLKTALSSDLPSSKIGLYNVLNNFDNNDDDNDFCSNLFDCNFSGSAGNVKYQTMMQKQIDDDIRSIQYNRTILNKSSKNKDKDKTKKNKKKKKKSKKSRKKKKNINDKLTILLNGSQIADMQTHVVEMAISEEEFYEEDDAQDEPYYDPNYLGVSPDDYY